MCLFRFHPLNTCVNFTIDGGEFGQIHHNPIHVRVRLNIDLIKSDSPVGLVSSTVLQATSCQNSLGRERVKPRVLLFHCKKSDLPSNVLIDLVLIRGYSP